jgi:hypothetical protein
MKRECRKRSRREKQQIQIGGRLVRIEHRRECDGGNTANDGRPGEFEANRGPRSAASVPARKVAATARAGCHQRAIVDRKSIEI